MRVGEGRRVCVVCVCVCMRMCVYACVCARVRVRVRARQRDRGAVCRWFVDVGSEGRGRGREWVRGVGSE